MENRTEQDNDIALYSYDELKTMMRILENRNSTTYVPFNYVEVTAELIRREISSRYIINL